MLPAFAARRCFRHHRHHHHRNHPHLPPTVNVHGLAKDLHRQLHTGRLTNLFDEAQAPALQIRNVSDSGIELEDGFVYPTACILLGGQSFSWRVPGQPWGVGWSSEAFEIFNVVSPKPGQFLLTTLLLRNPLISRP